MSNTQLATRTNDLKNILSSERMKQQFAMALPKHLSPERFCRIAITALTKNPKLADCTQESFMGCLLSLSAFGLEPDGRLAHIIPYGNTATLIIDYKGMAELAWRSGAIAKLHVDVVCENDRFDYNMGEVTTHSIDWHKERGQMYAAYAMAQTKDGAKLFAVMSKAEIDAIRKRSRSGSNGPWVSDYNEMAKKTVFRRLAKWLPLSAEFRDAADKDDEEFQQVREIRPASESKLFETTPALPDHLPLSVLMERDGVTWAELQPVLAANGEPAGEFADMMDLPDEDEQDLASRWTVILGAVKGTTK